MPSYMHYYWAAYTYKLISWVTALEDEPIPLWALVGQHSSVTKSPISELATILINCTHFNLLIFSACIDKGCTRDKQQD